MSPQLDKDYRMRPWESPMFKNRITEVFQEFAFNHNTPNSRLEIKHRLNVLFETFERQNYIIDYGVKCNEENNPPNVIDANQIVVDMDLMFRQGVIKRYRVVVRGYAVFDREGEIKGKQIFSEIDPYGEENW
jgi:hypothetical protein